MGAGRRQCVAAGLPSSPPALFRYGFTLLYVFLIREPLPKERRSKKKITWQVGRFPANHWGSL